jgi:hypothetical protein
LGLKIKPLDIRLNPRSTDPYSWNILAGNEAFVQAIFAKNLSDHSIGIYRFLCREVGQTFEAVSSRPACSIGNPTPPMHPMPGSPTSSLASHCPQLIRPDNSFGAIIEQLKRENLRLSQQLSKSISQEEAELERRLALEEENGILHSKQQPLEEQDRHHALGLPASFANKELKIEERKTQHHLSTSNLHHCEIS